MAVLDPEVRCVSAGDVHGRSRRVGSSVEASHFDVRRATCPLTSAPVPVNAAGDAATRVWGHQQAPDFQQVDQQYLEEFGSPTWLD